MRAIRKITSSMRVRRAARVMVTLLLAAVSGTMIGCETDSFLDPSKIGRWEKTPTIMPVLDRLSAIEEEPTEFVQTSQVQPADLVPEVDQYRMGPGDQLEVHIRDFFVIGEEAMFEQVVDSRGYIDLPRLPAIRAQGKTKAELISSIEDAVRNAQITQRPVVSILLKSQRKQTFAVLGAVQNPGTYYIPSPDYRLLEGLTAAGALNETVPYVYVVRQIPLTDAAAGRLPEPEPARKNRPGRPPTDLRPQGQPGTPAPTEQPQKKGEDLIDLIDEMSKPNKPASPSPKDEPKTPSVMGSSSPAAPVRIAAVEPPPIDLPGGTSSAPSPTYNGNGAGWAYVEGKWVRTHPGTEGAMAVSEQTLVAQRVIRIPMGPLLAGAADVNIVLRPGDVIRAPVPRGGIVYVTGEVVRPGTYNIPTDGRLTILRAVAAAGGLSALAIPERVDLMRMVGNDRQATIRLDLRAIGEQTQPDIYLKPDDTINVGSNFWAQPLAVIRNGFRASYGYGFILDRNFQGDVFGVDPAVAR